MVYEDRLFIELLKISKASDLLSWRRIFLVAILFAVIFFASSISLLLAATLLQLCDFSSGELDPRCWIMVAPGVGVLIFQFYLLLLIYHHSFSLHLLKREESSLLYCVIHCRPEKNVSWWLLSTTLRSDDHHRVIGTCHLKMNRCQCVFWNLIDSFWKGLDIGYTCLCIC